MTERFIVLSNTFATNPRGERRFAVIDQKRDAVVFQTDSGSSAEAECYRLALAHKRTLDAEIDGDEAEAHARITDEMR